VTSERKRKIEGRRKRSSLSTAARYLYSTGGGGVDLVRPQRVVDPVAMAWPPSCFQERLKMTASISNWYPASSWWASEWASARWAAAR
jgi:hypothetical protein